MGNAKQCDLKELVTVTQFAREAENVGDRAIYSRVPGCCERKWAADRADYRSRWSDCQLTADALRLQKHCAYQKGILVQKKSSVIGGRRIFLTKMHTTDDKGICRSSWRKCMRCPRRLWVPSLNKIAQTAAQPSPLWEFCAANCFRDLIVALQNENPRWSGLAYLNRITGTRRSVSKGRIMLVPFAPLEYKGIRSVSRRWWSIQNLWWSQVLTSVPNRISPILSLRYDKWLSLRNDLWLSFRNEDLHLRDKSHSALCKLSFAFVNDKLQEAEYDEHRLPKAGAGAVVSIWYMTVFSKWSMTFISKAEPFLSDASQIETARRQGRRAVISRA